MVNQSLPLLHQDRISDYFSKVKFKLFSPLGLPHSVYMGHYAFVAKFSPFH